MTTPLDRALKRLAELQNEMAEVRHFIEMYNQFNSEDRPGNSEPLSDGVARANPQLVGNEGAERQITPVDNGDRRQRRGRPAGGGPREIAEIMERVIREADRPLSRGEIVAALERREIEIPAQDKARYIGTIAWRNKGTFINIEGRGYWLRGDPLRKGSSETGPRAEAGAPADETPEELSLWKISRRVD